MIVSATYLILSLIFQPMGSSRAVVGSKAIDFTLQTFEGKSIKLSDYRGKVILLDFWASWCEPCREEMPYLDMLQKTYGMQGFSVVAVNIDNRPKNALEFLEKYSIRLTPVWDSRKQVVSAYGAQTMPTSIIIDQRGWIRYIHSGFKAEKFHTYKQQIEKLLIEGKRKSADRRRHSTNGL